MGTLTTSTKQPATSDNQAETIGLPSAEVISMSGQTSTVDPQGFPSNVPGAVTLKQLNESRPVTRMTIDEYRQLSQEQRDNLSGNYIEFPTAKSPVPALLVPIWDKMSPEQKDKYGGDPNSQTDLRITQYPSNQRIAENEQKHAEQRALMNQQQLQNSDTVTQTPPVTPPKQEVQPVQQQKPDTARLESLTKQYVDSVYSKFRGTDPKAPESELYKSLKNATDPEIIKIRELLYGKTDGGQDNDTGLYDVFRNGKESAETVMKRLANVPGTSVEEKFKYLESAIQKVNEYRENFGKPKAPVQPVPTPTTPPVNSSQSINPGAVTPNVPVQNSSVTENRSGTFNPADTQDVVRRLEAGEFLPVKTVEEMKVALAGLKNAGEMEWYEFLKMQARLRFGEDIG